MSLIWNWVYNRPCKLILGGGEGGIRLGVGPCLVTAGRSVG